MRHRLAALAAVLLVGPPAGLGADPPAAAPPFPLWPIPREARVADTRLLLTDATIVVPAGRPAGAVPRAPARRARRRPLRRGDPGGGWRRSRGSDPHRRGRGLRRARGRRGPARGAPGHRTRPRGTCSPWTRRAPWWRAATTAAPSTASPPSSSSSTAGASRASPCARPSSATGPSCPCAGSTSTCRAATSSASPAGTMRDLLLRFKFNGIVLEVGGGMRLESHPEISVGWKRTVAEWYAHGETMDKLGEGIPLGTARRFAASLHVGVGGGAYVEKDDVRALADLRRSLRPGDRPRGAGARPHLLHRVRPARRGRGPGHGVARLLLPVEPRVLPHLLRPPGRVPRRAAAEARAHRPRRVAGGGLLPPLPRQGHRSALRRGRPEDPPAPPREGPRDLDVGRPLRGRPQPLREAVVGGRRRPLREAGHDLGPRPHRRRDERHSHPELVGRGGRRHLREAGLAVHRRQPRGQRGEGLAGPGRPPRRPGRRGVVVGRVGGVRPRQAAGRGGGLQQQPPLVRARPEEGGRARARGPPAPRGAGDAGAEAAALVRRRPDALRGPRHRVRLQPPAPGRRLGPDRACARAATTSRGCPTRSPTPRAGAASRR